MTKKEKLLRKAVERKLTKIDIDNCKDNDLGDVLKAITESTSEAGLRHSMKASLNPEMSLAEKEFKEHLIDDLSEENLKSISREDIDKSSPDFLRATLSGFTRDFELPPIRRDVLGGLENARKLKLPTIKKIEGERNTCKKSTI